MPPTQLSNDAQSLVNKIVEASQHGDARGVGEWVQEIRHYSDAERTLLFSVLGEFRDKGYSLNLDCLWQIDFERRPVSITEFLDDPYYFGPRDPESGSVAGVLYPRWREDLLYVCDASSPVYEWILTGSIGAGKSYASIIAQIYKGPYFCSCLKHPQQYFGLAPGTSIVFGVFNVTKDNAENVNFEYFRSMIDRCSYFKECCPRKPITTTVEFPTKNMEIRVGSSELHTLGANMFSFLMDEANFMMKGGEEGSQAWKIYKHAIRRMESRFLSSGMCPGLVCLVSSKKSKSSFLERHLEQSRSSSTVYVSDYALWEIKDRTLFSPSTFRVSIGDSRRSSRILDAVKGDTVSRSEEDARGLRILEVPIDFYEGFRRDLMGSLRDIAGIETDAVYPLITRVESLYECIDHTRSHPFIADSVELPLSDPGANLLHMVKWEMLTRVEDSRRVLKVRPGVPRFAHVDLGLTEDCVGITVAHGYDAYQFSEYDPTTGETNIVYRPKVYVDFMLRITPTDGTEIDITKIVSFLLNLRHYGVPLKRVTWDGYQSRTGIQILEKARFAPPPNPHVRLDSEGSIQLEASVLSIDRTDVPYTLLRDTLNYNALSFYEYPLVLNELVALEHKVDTKVKSHKWTVDHPPHGSKDISDSLAGAVYGVLTQVPAEPMTPEAYSRSSSVGAGLETSLLSGVLEGYSNKDHLVSIEPPPRVEKARPLSSRSTFGKFGK